MTETALLWYSLIGVSAPVAGASAVYAWRRRPEPGAEALTAMLLAVAWWSATYLGELLATTLSGKLLWARLEWFGSILIPIAWLLFALEYTGRDQYVTRRTVGALLVPWVASIALVWTNPLHHLVKVPLGLERVDGLVLLDQTFGPWFLLMAVYTYALVLAGGGLLVGVAASDQVVYRGQALGLLAAAFIPLVVNVYSVFAATVDLTPFAFSVTGVAILAAMSRYELLRATPIAALTGGDVVIESMDDGVLVVDRRDRVVHANDATERLLGRRREAIVGEDLSDVFPAWTDATEGRPIVQRRSGRTDLFLEVNATALRNRRDHEVGRTLVVRDVTERHEHHERIGVLDRVLRHDLRNEMNVVLGHVEALRAEFDGDAPAVTDDIDRAAERLLEIGERARQIDRYLERSSRSRRVDLETLLRDVVDGAVQRYPDVTVEVVSLPDGRVACDGLLEPVLENLVDNGIRHDPGPDPHVSIRADLGDDTLALEVADDGHGIPETERAVLDAGPETPLAHGSGLGLWLVKWSLTRLDGSLSFETDGDGGTIALVRVPRLDDDRGPPRSGPGDTNGRTGPGDTAGRPGTDPSG